MRKLPREIQGPAEIFVHYKGHPPRRVKEVRQGESFTIVAGGLSSLEEGPTGSKGTDPHPPKDGHTSKKPRPTDDPNDPQAAAQAMKAFKEELKSLKKEL